MNILWLINVSLPESSSLMKKKSVLTSGSWLLSGSYHLSIQKGINLSIAFPCDKVKKFTKCKGEIITYYPFPPIAINDKKTIEKNEYFYKILQTIKPDIVHIFGTEMAHSLSMVNICNIMNIKTIISIQGLVSIIANHMLSGLPFKAVYMKTVRNVIREDNVSGLRKTFIRRGKNEISALKHVKNVIGRTTWDKACALQINPSVKYYHCNEILREEFYKHIWQLEKCEKYSIFLSQGQYSVKGLHFVVEAFPLILKKNPKAKIYIGGKDITKSKTMKDKLFMTYYGKYLKRMIKERNIEDNVIFTGPLDEKKMCERFLKSHVFVSSSTIENESNSLSEARILGVPTVASYVGGVIDRIDHNIDGFLYQHDAPYMLAYYICKIFDNNDIAVKFSKNAREQALKTHDRDGNTRSLIAIYQKIMQDG